MRLALVYHQMIASGGLERYLLGLARRLRDRGHELTLVTAETDGEAESLNVGIRRVDLGGVPGFLRHWRFAHLAARLELPVELTLGFGRTWRQDLHRAGGGCHALYSRELPWFKRWGLKNRLELSLERRLYSGHGTRHYIVNAAPVADQLRSVYGVPSERLSVIHTAVDTDHFCPRPDRSANRRPVLLFVSSHHRRKGLDGLLRAMVRMPEADLWVAGSPLTTRYRRMIQRHQLDGRVQVLGEVPDLATVYQRADWFVHPTLYDACANTVLQSMASGLPGLISVADGASEFVDDGNNGFLLTEPKSDVEIERTLRRAFSLTPAQRRDMSASARQSVLPLTWEAHLAAWEELFSRLAHPLVGGGDGRSGMT